MGSAPASDRLRGARNNRPQRGHSSSRTQYVVKPQSGHRRRGISRRRLAQRPSTVPTLQACDRSTRRPRRRHQRARPALQPSAHRDRHQAAHRPEPGGRLQVGRNPGRRCGVRRRIRGPRPPPASVRSRVRKDHYDADSEAGTDQGRGLDARRGELERAPIAPAALRGVVGVPESAGGGGLRAYPSVFDEQARAKGTSRRSLLVQGERGDTAARALAASQMRASSRCDRGVVGSLTACLIDVSAGAPACRARRRSGFDSDGAGVLADLVGRPDEVLDAVAAMPKVSAQRRYRGAAAADGEALAIRGRQPAAARRLPQAGAQRRPRLRRPAHTTRRHSRGTVPSPPRPPRHLSHTTNFAASSQTRPPRASYTIRAREPRRPTAEKLTPSNDAVAGPSRGMHRPSSHSGVAVEVKGGRYPPFTFPGLHHAGHRRPR